MTTRPFSIALLLAAAAAISACKNPSSQPAAASGDAAASAQSQAGFETNLVEIAVSPGANEPLPLIAGQGLTGSFLAPRAGVVRSLSVEIGNNLNTSDGQLSLKLCQAGVCETGSSPLAGSADNQYLKISLGKSLAIAANAQVEFTLTKDGGSVPVAVWTYAASNGTAGMTDSKGASIPRTPRLAVEFEE